MRHPLTPGRRIAALALFNVLILPLNAYPWVVNGMAEMVSPIAGIDCLIWRDELPGHIRHERERRRPTLDGRDFRFELVQNRLHQKRMKGVGRLQAPMGNVRRTEPFLQSADRFSTA
jgi:hypothetical protein